MRIAQISPLIESVPPKWYGGTERVVAFLTEELVRMGHDVTLFASGDSVTSANLVAPCPRSLRLDEKCEDPFVHQILMLEMVCRRAHQFDIIHFHIDYAHFPLVRRIATPCVTTLHGRMDIAERLEIYAEFDDMRVVSISDSQRLPLAFANWQATVQHGLPLNLLTYHETPGEYLAFLGRISPEKRVDRAIQLANRLRMPLKIAAKINPTERKYFQEQIEPMLGGPYVEFVGEISDKEKSDFLGNARALLFPIDWPEPFGLAMIESMACGTPVVAFRCGSVPEVVDQGVTGFIVDNLDDAAGAVERVRSLDRRRCRKVFEERFSAERMARDYVGVYERILGEGHGDERTGFAERYSLVQSA